MHSRLARSALPLCALVLAVLACALSAPLLASAQPAVNYTSYSALVTQLRSTPYDPAFHSSIAQTLRRCIPMYAFNDLALDSSIGAPPGAQFTQQNINVSARVEAFAAASFSSNFDVEDAAGDIFLGLNDAHTLFHRSYSAFGFARPFRLSTRVVPLPGGALQQSIFIAETPLYDALYKSVYGYSPLDNVTLVSTGASLSLSSVDGFEVVQIDGQDAVAHLWNIASDQTAFRVGLSKDTHTRFNLVVDGRSQFATGPPGAFSFRSMGSFGIPPNPWTELQLRDPANPQMVYAVRYQWLGMTPQNNQMTFGAALSTPTAKLKRNPVLRAHQMEEHMWSIFSLQHPSLAQQRAQVLGLTAPLSVSAPTAAPAAPRFDRDSLRSGPQGIPGAVTFEVLADNTGVLKIYTFEPESDAPFIAFLQQALTTHQQSMGGTKLIIDLRGNGGGEICLGYSILRFIFPAISHPTFAFDAADFPFARYDLIVSPLSQLLADIGAQQFKSNPYDVTQCQNFFTPCTWLNPQTQLPFVDETWFDSGRTFNRGGKTSQYSALFHYNCASDFAAWVPADINQGYSPDNTVILSDGMCGSTCSAFSSFIKAHHLAKSVVLGGVQPSASLPGSTQGHQFWSYPGGQVIVLDYMLVIIAGYGLNSTTSPLVPAPIPGDAKFTWTLREIYPWDDTQGLYPSEFLHVPADFQFQYATNFSDSEGIYSTLIQSEAIFSPATSCVQGITALGCPLPNGQGAYACVNGVVGTQCLASMCDAGYFVESATATCQPCPAGQYRAASTDPTQQSSCSQCTLPAPVVTPPVTRDDRTNVTCVGGFTAQAWTAEPCPYSVVCNATSLDPPHDGRDHDRDDWVRPSKYWTTVVLMILLSAFLFIIVVVQCAQRVAHKRNSRGREIDMDFQQM